MDNDFLPEIKEKAEIPQSVLEKFPENQEVIQSLLDYQSILEEQNYELRAKQKTLEEQFVQTQKMESLGTIASGVAHDMNNVLAAISNMAEIGLTTSSLDTIPAHREAFEVILKASIRGSQLVKSLLAFARKGSSEMLVFDLNNIVREEIEILKRTTLSKINIIPEISNEPLSMFGDSNAIMNALTNICINAVDAMPDGGHLLIRTKAQDNWVVLTVQDTGTGMPSEILEKAFDPFYTTKPEGKGTGLGLPMVRSTVEAHRGKLELQSIVGKGTTLIIKFPVTRSHELVPVHEKQRAAMETLTVMIVDDDDLVRESLRALIESLGHEIIVADTGEKAIELLKKNILDIVILDMNMPGQGGPETLRIIRKLQPFLPVILSTGRVDAQVQDLLDQHALTSLLAKPFSVMNLKDQLRKMMHKVSAL